MTARSFRGPMTAAVPPAYHHCVSATPVRHRRRRADAVIAVAFALVLAALVLVTPGRTESPSGLAVALGGALVQGASLAFIRRRPEQAMAVAVLAGVGIEAFAPNVGWLGQAAAVLAGYARTRPPRRSLPVLALLIAGTPWKLAHGDWRSMLLAIAGPVIGWALGELGRTHRLRREDEQRRIVAQERARISRELHDVLAHTVSVIVVQAAAAEDVFDARPDLARRALGSIHTAARATLAELRVLLQSMHDDGDPVVDAPQPGLAQLDALATSLRATGLQVVLDRDPGARPLPAAVDLSAYRIVQESLTNTLRHSQATRAHVTVRHADDAVRLEIRDAGPARPVGRVDGSGHRGIVGMRERARLLGGTLDAGPLPDGGFRVRADLPLEPVA
jgi:signal transduction histidine kinase